MKKVKLVKPEKSIGSIDLPFMVLVLTLVIFGLIMLFSASYATAYYRFNDSYKFIKQQAFFAVIGVIAMFVASRVDYHIFHKLALPLLALTMVLLVIV
ncbi:MAG: FtsW/RodA/SpoVE family cell cycle protein, partial [Pygmaiobacter massiliensis]